MPIPSNQLLFAKEKENVYLLKENITTKVDATLEIQKLLKLSDKAIEDGNFYEGISYLEEIINLEKRFLGKYHPDLAETLNYIGEIYLINLYEYDKAESYFVKSLKIREKKFSAEHPNIASALNNLGFLYYQQKLFKKAEPLYLRALKIREKRLGDNHPFTSLSLRNLGILYKDQGLYKKAEPLLIKSLKIDIKNLGSDHPDIATNLNELAMLYHAQGLYEEAELHYNSALKIDEKNFGVYHPETEIILQNLGGLYLDQNLYRKAIPVFERALAINRKTLGSEHEQIASDLNNLALLKKDLALYKDAENLYLEALEIRKNVLGINHPDTATSIDNLARLYQDQELFTKAEDLFFKALEIRKNVLGINHPDTAVSKNNLGSFYLNQGLFEKAEKFFKKSLKINEKVYGDEHQNTAISLDNLAFVYIEQDLFKEAEPIVNRALLIFEKTLGKDHPDTAICLSRLAYIYELQGLNSKAETLYYRSLEINKKAFGDNHPSTAHNYVSLGNIYSNQNRYKKAEIFFRKALNIREVNFGSFHSDVSNSLINIAEIFYIQGQYSKAEPLYERALSIDEKVLGKNHHITATTLNKLAMLYQDQGNYKKAEPLLLRALNIRERIYGLYNSTTASSLNTLATNYQALGEYQKSETLFLRALKINKRVYGKKSPQVSISLNNLGLLYEDQDLDGKAEKFYKKTLAIDNNSSATLNNLGLLYRRKGLYKKAEAQFLKALQIDKKVYGDFHPIIQLQLDNLSVLYQDQGNLDKSIELTKKALNMKFSLIQRELPYLAINDRKLFIDTYGSTYERAFSFIDKHEDGLELAFFSRINMQGLLEEIEKRQAKVSSIKGPQKIISDKLIEIARQISNKDISIKDRKILTKEKESLERKLYQMLPEMKSRIVSVNQIAQVIPENSVLIEFIKFSPYNNLKGGSEKWDEERYLALALDKRKNLNSIDLGPANKIDVKIKQALISSEQFLPDAEDLWADVGNLIINPLINIIDDKKTLFLSPDGELNRIPFAAISSHKKNRLLNDVFNIRVLTTGRELIDLVKQSKTNNNKSLVVANPEFDQSNKNSSKDNFLDINPFPLQKRSSDFQLLNWEPLPGTSREGKIITKITSAEFLTGDKATALAIQKISSPKIIHIASHAYYMPNKTEKENPLLRSGIVLAGANQPYLNIDDDGYLLALEVTKLDWKDTEMAVISGCESGKGDILSGEGVYGLKRAISVAGAKSSILSLWKVDDTGTAVFMEEFYKKLKKGIGRADALAETQKEFRSHQIPGFRHPGIWAAFQLTGDWRPIKWK